MGAVKNDFIEKQQEEMEKIRQEFANHDCTGDGCYSCQKYYMAVDGGY